jgi:hypothetical protein
MRSLKCSYLGIDSPQRPASCWSVFGMSGKGRFQLELLLLCRDRYRASSCYRIVSQPLAQARSVHAASSKED